MSLRGHFARAIWVVPSDFAVDGRWVAIDASHPGRHTGSVAQAITQAVTVQAVTVQAVTIVPTAFLSILRRRALASGPGGYLGSVPGGYMSRRTRYHGYTIYPVQHRLNIRTALAYNSRSFAYVADLARYSMCDERRLARLLARRVAVKSKCQLYSVWQHLWPLV